MLIMHTIKQPKLLNYKNIKTEKYYFKHPFKTNNNFYMTPLSYSINKNDKLPYIFETPKLKTINGIVRVDNDFYIDLELSTTGEIGKFYDFLIINDNYNVKVCHENSLEWFGNNIPLHMIEKFYKSPILLKTEGRLPIFRIRIPNHKGNVLCEIFNDRKEQIFNYESIEANDMVMCIIEFTGLLFMNQTFIANYELHKIKVFKNIEYYHKSLPDGYLFSDCNEKIDIIDNYSNSNTKTILDYPVKERIENILTLIQNNQENHNNIDNKTINNIDNSMDNKSIDISSNSNIVGLDYNIVVNQETNTNSNNSMSLFEICKNASLKTLFDFNDFKIIKKEKMKKESSRPTTPIICNTIEDVEEYDIPFGVDTDIEDEIINMLESNIENEPENKDDIDYTSLNDLEMIIF